jgi:hypothetical protein
LSSRLRLARSLRNNRWAARSSCGAGKAEEAARPTATAEGDPSAARDRLEGADAAVAERIGDSLDRLSAVGHVLGHFTYPLELPTSKAGELAVSGPTPNGPGVTCPISTRFEPTERRYPCWRRPPRPPPSARQSPPSAATVPSRLPPADHGRYWPRLCRSAGCVPASHTEIVGRQRQGRNWGCRPMAWPLHRAS